MESVYPPDLGTIVSIDNWALRELNVCSDDFPAFSEVANQMSNGIYGGTELLIGAYGRLILDIGDFHPDADFNPSAKAELRYGANGEEFNAVSVYIPLTDVEEEYSRHYTVLQEAYYRLVNATA